MAQGIPVDRIEGGSGKEPSSRGHRDFPRVRPWDWRIGSLLFASVLAGFPPVVAAASSAHWPDRIAADWLLAEEMAVREAVSRPVTTQADAAGGCDGVKDGTWGFHTEESPEPWWQVDLGEAQAIDRVVVWNRPQAAERAARLAVRVSDDGKRWRTVYQHDGSVFYGSTDRRPLELSLERTAARFVRIQLPGRGYLHLEEVEVFGPREPARNLALGRPADQVSVSQWSRDHVLPVGPDWKRSRGRALANSDALERELRAAGVGLDESQAPASADEVSASQGAVGTASVADPEIGAFLNARSRQRLLALRNPLLDFDALLFTKRTPPSFNHMSDQYYGWWSKPGGGIYLLRGFTTGNPTERCLTRSFTAPGSFLRPTLSYDARKVLFAWCRYYPHLAAEPNKLDKANVPEDAFYHLFEMNLDGTGVRQLTRGKYDDFDGRYLPDGRVVFLSTRRGQALQVGRHTAAQTVLQPDLPDCYVRCGGGPERPVAVYTLHTMNADGSGLCAISPFEMFEWTPEIGRDGAILYSRWDYIDRDNMPYMGLWAIHPDGSNARMVFKNYTKSPHCTFEAKPIPGSHRLVFTASAHHAQTMGSLVLLDPSAGLEGHEPIVRLTPEVPFPEIEGWPQTYYANPWPLSERFHLVAWGYEGARVPGPAGWDRWHAVQRPANGTALYLYDAALRTRELLWVDPEIACGDPIPVRPRPRPPVIASVLPEEDVAAGEGRFLLADVTRGLRRVAPGEIKLLRVVAVPAKTHPTMNAPNLGITADDPGKCVLGTVPVEADGSAHFRVPAGVILFFQALDARGIAVQTMRSATHVQPGQTLSCIGCHEHRQQAPPTKPALAASRPPSKLTPGPVGSWPLRFDRLVQPVLDTRCVSCHRPDSDDAQAARTDLSPAKAYESLVGYGKPSLRDLVWAAYRQGSSTEGEGISARSALRRLIEVAPGHYEVQLTEEERERLYTWMDTYAQRLGHFDARQEEQLLELRQACSDLLLERSAEPTTPLATTR